MSGIGLNMYVGDVKRWLRSGQQLLGATVYDLVKVSLKSRSRRLLKVIILTVTCATFPCILKCISELLFCGRNWVYVTTSTERSYNWLCKPLPQMLRALCTGSTTTGSLVSGHYTEVPLRVIQRATQQCIVPHYCYNNYYCQQDGWMILAYPNTSTHSLKPGLMVACCTT